MSDRPQSKLPRDPAYWEGLERRIRDDAAGPLAAYAAAASGTAEPWFAVLARRAPWLVAASLAAIVLLWLALPPRGGSPALAWMEVALTPDEPAGTLVSGAIPPAVDDLLVHFPPAADPEEQR